ncbi:hypothetical protein F25303_8025 [Fusarium sp. NRRL 25303]|nr:hypothetical protein F25303_8025 [Fusarium sp. NRRL 25303]
MDASTLPTFPPPADVEMSLSDDDEQDNPHQDYRELLNDERCVDLLDQGACHDHPDNNTPGTLLIWQANIKRCEPRVKALCTEIDRRLYGESPRPLPHVIAVQDLCYKQAFHGIPGYHVWYLSGGQFTEEDYDPDAQHKKWTKVIDKCLEALQRAEVAINVSRPSLGPASITAQRTNDTLVFAHKRLSDIRQMTFTNEDTTAIAKSTLLCVSNMLMGMQKMATESLAACPDAPSPLMSAKQAFCSVQKSIFTGVNGLSDKSFQSKAAPKMHSVGFYVHNSIPTTSWRVKTCKGANRELLATLEITTATKPLAIHNVYNHLNKLKVDPLISYLDSYTGHSILLGDFNYHHEDWNVDQKTETSTSGKKFAEGVKAHNILKTKKGAITYSNSKDVSKRSSTIDLTFAKNRSITPNKFQRHLKPRLPPLDSPVGKEEQVVAFFAKVIDALHVTMMENVPKRSCGLRPQAQRTMQLASKLRERLAKLDDIKKKDQTPKTLKRILFLERDIDRLNTEMWSDSDSDKTRPPSTRAFFNVFRLARDRSQPLQFAQIPTLKYEGDSDAGNKPQLAVADQQKIEMIKKVKFRNNNNPESTRILEEPGPRHDPKREDIHIPRDVDTEKLRTIIKGLKNNNAPGPNKVPNEAIKLGMELLLPYFVLGFRACLNLSLRPANFKDSIIVMLLKAGKEPDKPESYRPISLLSTVGKLYERILADMMLDALKEHPHLLPATQFGNKITTEALQYLFRIICSTWCSNSDDVVTILDLDMSSAYDNVYRQKLLQTLYNKGFPRWFVDIIGLVLSLRDATMRLPGIISEPFELNTGIPQGSPISTVLFFFFVSPLVERTFPPRRIYVDGRKETVRLYQFPFVDDVYYIAVSRSYTINCRGLEILHEQMLSIAKELFINFGSHKYHVMHMRLPTVRLPTHNQVKPMIKGFVEEVQEKMTILGVIVDSQMNFDLHVTEITRKCRQRLGYMKRISGSTWGPDMYAICQYYLTLIRPVITYACGAWFIKQREGVSTRLNFGPRQEGDWPPSVLAV